MTWHLAACNDKASADALAAALDALGWGVSELHRGDRLFYSLDHTRPDIPDGAIAAMQQHATNYGQRDTTDEIVAWIAINWVGDPAP